MFAHRVVEALDVIEHVRPGVLPCPVDLAAEPFGLHRREEAFYRGVVPAFTATTHAAGDALSLEQLLEVVAGVLGLVQVMHQRTGFATPPKGHQKSVAHHHGLHGALHRPPHDAA